MNWSMYQWGISGLVLVSREVSVDWSRYRGRVTMDWSRYRGGISGMVLVLSEGGITELV